MHEEQHRQPCLDDGDHQHAGEHLRSVKVLIGNDELHACESKQANIDDQVFPDSVALVPFRGCRCHSILPPSVLDLVAEVQKIDQRYDEHPNQIYEVPIKAQNLDVIRLVAAALVAHSHHEQSDNATRNVREMQTCDAEERCPEQTGAPRILKERH